MTGRLQDKVCIITGAASGFGKGVAIKFVSEGAKVIIADLSEDAGMQVAQELGCEFSTCDVTCRNHWKSLLRKTLEVYGSLDIVINNAGATYANKPTSYIFQDAPIPRQSRH